MILRDAHMADAAALATLITQLGYPCTTEQMEQRLTTLLAEKNYYTLVLEVNGTVIAMAGFLLIHQWERPGSYVKIQALVVEAQHRKQGIGKKLIEAITRKAQELGATYIALTSAKTEERKAAHAFYPALGFEARSISYRKMLDTD